MKKRPTGITILSILALIGGVLIIIPIVKSQRNASNILFVSIYFLGLLAVVSGIGMLLGKKWGWWIGAFYYVYAILRYSNVIMTIFIKYIPSRGMIPEIKEHILEYSIRIIIHSLVLLYFFRKDVMEYFNVSHYSKLKPILILFGTGISIMIIGTLVSYIL